MSERSDPIGVAVFLAVLLGVVALLVLPAPDDDGRQRPLLTFTVAPEAPLEFVVPAGAEAIKLVTLAEAVPSPDPLYEPSYTLDLVWTDDRGAEVAPRRLTLTSRPSAAPDDPDVDPALEAALAPRSTFVRVPSPQVTGLRLSVPADGPAVRVRAFRDRPAPLATPELSLLRLDERDALVLARQIGLEDWHEITVDEALALAALRWEAINPRRGTLAPETRRVSVVADPPLASYARRAAGTPLPPGRATAWTLTAPTSALLVADSDLDGLALRAVVEGLGERPVRVLPDVPPAWRPDAEARRVWVDGEGEATLHALHQGAGPLGRVLLLLDREEAARLPVDAEIAPVSTFQPLPPDAPDPLSVVPSWNEVERRAAAAAAPVAFPLPPVDRDVVVRLELRPTRLGDPAPVAVEVAVLGAAGEGRRHAVSVPLLPSPYELAAPRGAPLDPARAVGEPVDRFVRVAPGDTRLEVRVLGGGEVLAAASMPGPMLGGRPVWDDQRLTRVRYARDGRTPWVALPADGPPDWRVAALRRREVLAPDEGGRDPGQVPRFRSLDPVARAAGLDTETWLLPLGDAAQDPPAGGDGPDGVAGLVYCGLSPSPDPQPLAWDPAAAGELQGILAAVLWAPGAAGRPTLGDPVELALGGRPWLREVLSSPVLRHAGRAAPSRAVRFTGPPGARAWVRTVADAAAPPCDDPWRARRLVALAPGETRAWRLHKRADSQLLVFGGVGDGPVDLSVTVRPSTERDGLGDDWTLRHRVLHLRPREAAVALDTPWREAVALETAGLRLRSDLMGPVEVRVTPVSEATVRLYAVIEDGGAGPQAQAPRRVAR